MPHIKPIFVNISEVESRVRIHVGRYVDEVLVGCELLIEKEVFTFVALNDSIAHAMQQVEEGTLKVAARLATEADGYVPSQIMQYFEYSHLPPHLQKVSKPIGVLAEEMDRLLPNGAEKSAGLRKLLEAKDCLVRANLPVKG